MVYEVLYSIVFWLVGRMIQIVYRELGKKQNRVFSLVSHWLGAGKATWNFSPPPSLPVGQNRVMDRYSPPTNYWVNIKYQIRKSRSKLRLYSKSAILRAQQLFSSWCHQTLEVIVPVGILSSSIKQTKLHVSIVIAKKNWIWLVESQSWTFRQLCVLKKTPIQFCSCMFLLKPWRMTSENRSGQIFHQIFPSSSISQTATQ